MEYLMRSMLLTMVALVTGICVTANADEVAVPLDKVPKAILDAVKKRFPKAELVEAAKETEGDKIEFEMSIKDGGTKIDVMLNSEGKITLIEKMINVKSLPKTVLATIEEKFAKAVIKTAEEVIKVTDGKEALDFYEVLLTTSEKKILELKITAAGKITETEEKKEEKKDK